MNALKLLKERGFIAQMTHENEMYELFDKQKVVFYTGYDPTADSLHIGHYLTFMASAWLQRAGHIPVVLMGGGTGMVGDPDKANEMRKMMEISEIDYNIEKFIEQAKRFIDFEDDKAILANNADWLRHLNYASFIREYGVHFSVNQMLSAEKYKIKFETPNVGLNFFELNYVIMQAYDFLELNRRFGCVLQTGGSDQWSNIVAGVDLIRRVEGKDKPAFGLTFNLLLTSDGKKMGKTMDGTLWLNGQKTHPNDFYQYFRNLPDTDIKKCLLMLTFLPMDEIEELCAEEGAAMNRAKEVLAFEVTKIVHGEQEAQNARDDLKSFAICAKDFGEGMNIMDVLVLTGLEKSKSDARRSVQQGGASAGGEKIADIGHMVRPQDLDDGKIIIQKGKKKVLIVVS